MWVYVFVYVCVCVGGGGGEEVRPSHPDPQPRRTNWQGLLLGIGQQLRIQRKSWGKQVFIIIVTVFFCSM